MSDALARLLETRLHAPFDVLGPHCQAGRGVLRALIPNAVSVRADPGPALRPVAPSLFEWSGAAEALPPRYELVWQDRQGTTHRERDPYAFPPPTDGCRLDDFHNGRHARLGDVLGSRQTTLCGHPGVLFAVWAPHAERVSVIGPFNGWDGRRHPMQVQGSSGVWWLFIPGLEAGQPYRYEIRNRHTGEVVTKSDPMARAYTDSPMLESLTTTESTFVWSDDAWMTARRTRDWPHEPLAIYEVHLGSWRNVGIGMPPLQELAVPLADHVSELGFTHVELLPVMEHPFGGSWGYQTLGYFATAHRYGSNDDLRCFIDTLHRRGIGVILDWTPAHFPRDAHGLAWYDGEPLYEYADPRLAVHPDWNTAIFDYGRGEVQSFLLSSAVYWLEEFHADGLRVDAVASMLHRDYSRPPGDFAPNCHGGRENLEAVEFLRRLNETARARVPGVLMIAEESTTWPMVTREPAVGGLGFSLKWNMGWMHDTLDYLHRDPVHRSFHHDELTFGVLYAHTEQFLLPLSHDEVVHGKSSLLHKMSGDDWQKFASLRLLYCYQYAFPGKKLLFMGAEFGVREEWSHDTALDWPLLKHAEHQSVSRLLTDLNRLYRNHPALHHDSEPNAFEWIDCHDHSHSVISFCRRGAGRSLVFVLNFTPVVRHGYRIGVPEPGCYAERLNSDSHLYGGSNQGNLGEVTSREGRWMGRPAYLELTLPPLAALVLERC